MPKLTKRVVDALQPDPAGRDVIHFDGEIPGLGVRVKPSGVKSYVLKYRNKFGHPRRFTFARVGDLTPEQARTKATKLRGAIADGADPASERQAAKGAMTVAELCDEYLEAGQGRIKASTLRVDRSRIDRHVKPLLGNLPVASLTPAQMEKFLRDVMAGKSVRTDSPSKRGAQVKRPRGGVAKGGPAVASRTLGMLGTILERAVRDGALAKNPVRGIERPAGNEAKPPFSFDRVRTIGKALREASTQGENGIGIHAIKLLLLTGCRRDESLTLQWETIDFHGRCFRFKDTKSGKQMRAVGRSALDLLLAFKPKSAPLSDYVFPGAGKSGHLVGLPKVWKRVTKRAGILDVTIHGLRHWFASAATELGYSDIIIGALIGHKPKGITGRYATAPDPALLAAADRVSARLAEALDGATAAKVVSLSRA